jgi:hypothetical protein
MVILDAMTWIAVEKTDKWNSAGGKEIVNRFYVWRKLLSGLGL